ncbi:MAG: SpoIIE family protein phosphatase [Vicinamibacteria bacterium]|nr:SpoIIE family protein phosphatase [Vicinamibacteria bacterium]
MSQAKRPRTGEITRPRPDTGTARIVRPNYLLPGTESVRKEPSLWSRLFAFLKNTWGGRLMLAAVLCGVAEAALTISIPLPWRTTLIVLLLIYGRTLPGRVVRALLYRVRAKLLMAYVLTALVPLVLGVLFILVSWMILFMAFSTRLVTNEFDRREATLGAVASTALSVAESGTASKADLDAAFATALTQHAAPAWTVVRGGVVLASRGAAPHKFPSWIDGDRFSGLVRDGETKMFRAVSRHGQSFAIVEIPYDSSLFEALENESGVVVNVDNAPRGAGRPRVRVSRQSSGSAPFAATHDQFDWETGARSSTVIPFSVSPPRLYASLTPGKERISQVLLFALVAVAVLFAFVYLVALLFGTALVRSITGSIHALSVGTRKLQVGDFSHRIIVRSQDQLGDLARSFNSMSQGIEDLLEQQGEKERMEEDLRVARNIQMSLLPQEYVEVEGLKIAAVCLPANEMGGDYYDLLPLSNHRLGVLIADVSGKGTSAALYMAELKGLILSLSRNHDSPKALLSELNEILSPNLDRRSFVTMTYAIIDSMKRTLRVARAGHNPLIHFDGRTGQTRLLSPPGLALGFDSGERFKAVIQEIELPLVHGDSFLFFTDGISEAMNGSAELFGEGRLASILKDANELSSDDLKERILDEVRIFAAGESPHDDMTLVIVKVV